MKAPTKAELKKLIKAKGLNAARVLLDKHMEYCRKIYMEAVGGDRRGDAEAREEGGEEKEEGQEEGREEKKGGEEEKVVTGTCFLLKNPRQAPVFQTKK